MLGFKTAEVQFIWEHKGSLAFRQLLPLCTSAGVLHSARNNRSELWVSQLKQKSAHRPFYSQHTEWPGRPPLQTYTALNLNVFISDKGTFPRLQQTLAPSQLLVSSAPAGFLCRGGGMRAGYCSVPAATGKSHLEPPGLCLSTSEGFQPRVQ